jgi:hypothetical protein
VSVGRVTASAHGLIEAPADVVWELLLDWGNFPIRGRFPGVETVVLSGGAGSALTRTINFHGGFAVTEHLLLNDTANRRMYCRTDNNGGDWRNYLATLYVDELAPTRCRVSIHGFCDVANEAEADKVKASIEASWASGILGGLQRCLGSPQPDAHPDGAPR